MNIVNLFDTSNKCDVIIREKNRTAVLDHVFNFADRRDVCICGCGQPIRHRGLGDHSKMSIWGRAYFFHSLRCHRRARKVLETVKRGKDPRHELRRRLAVHVIM